MINMNVIHYFHKEYLKIMVNNEYVMDAIDH